MTPTREQLAELLEEVKRWIYHQQPAEEDNARKKLDHVIACLAAPPPEPQAMPPIAVGDVVTQMGHGRPVAVLVEDVDDHLLTVRHLAHSETIHYKHALAIYKPVWTREPRR